MGLEDLTFHFPCLPGNCGCFLFLCFSSHSPWTPLKREMRCIHLTEQRCSQTESKTIEILDRTNKEAGRLASVGRYYVATACPCKSYVPALARQTSQPCLWNRPQGLTRTWIWPRFGVICAPGASNCSIWIWSPTVSGLDTCGSDPKEEGDEDAMFPVIA